MTDLLSRSDTVPVCPKCSRHEYLEVGFVFRASTGALLRSVWQCSRAYEGWAGCGWTGPAPARVHLTGHKTEPVKHVTVQEFTETQQDLQSTADLILVRYPDGEKEIVS